MKKNTFFYIMAILLLLNFLVISLLLLKMQGRIDSRKSFTALEEKSQFFSCDQKYDYANLLLSKNLRREAIFAFEDYLGSCAKDPEDMSAVNFTIGKIYLHLHNYEKALAYFYKAEALNKKFGEVTAPYIVETLDRMGLIKESQSELDRMSGLKGTKKKIKGRAIARIGNEEIKEEDINEILNDFPAELQQYFSKEQSSQELIKQYIVQKILYRKAKKIGIDKTPRIRKFLDSTLQQMAVSQLLETEVFHKVKVTDSDLKLYYNACKEDFSQGEAVNVKYVKFQKMKELNSAKKKLRTDPDARNIWLGKDEIEIPGIGKAEDQIQKLFSLRKGRMSGVLQINKAFYVFKVEDKKEAGYFPFEDVKEYIRIKYLEQKQKELLDGYINKLMKEYDVEIYNVKNKDKAK